MSRCSAITLKGDRCKNKAIEEGLCRIHIKAASSKPIAKKSTQDTDYQPPKKSSCDSQKKIVIIHFLTDDSQLGKDQLYCDTDIEIKYDIIYIATRDAIVPPDAYATLVYCQRTTDRIFADIMKTLKGVKNATFISAGGILVPENNNFRVLNASYENKRYRVVHVIEGKNYHMVNVSFPYYSDLLNCQWWFMYFINKVDDCGSGRLLQVRGTCYINSTVNGFILGRSGKVALKYVKTRKELDRCSRKSEDSIDSILYTAICSRKRIEDEYDIFEESQEGGNPPDVFERIMKVFGASYALLDANNTESEIQRKFDSQIKMANSVKAFATESAYNTIVKNAQDDYDEDMKKLRDTLKGLSSKEFVAVYCNTVSDVTPMKLKGLELDFRVVGLLSVGDSHAVIGFMCNGVPKVYDSGINKIITADWKSPEGIKKLLKMENKYWGKEYFINITSYMDVYVNKGAQEGRCP